MVSPQQGRYAQATTPALSQRLGESPSPAVLAFGTASWRLSHSRLAQLPTLPKALLLPIALAAAPALHAPCDITLDHCSASATTPFAHSSTATLTCIVFTNRATITALTIALWLDSAAPTIASCIPIHHIASSIGPAAVNILHLPQGRSLYSTSITTFATSINASFLSTGLFNAHRLAIAA